MPAPKLLRALLKTESPSWVAVQQLSVRGLVALKFLLVARLLGPSAIGEIVVALVAISIAEALTQIGLEHGIVQTRDRLSGSRQNAVWTMQVARGLIIALGLFLASGAIANLFGSPSSARLVALASLIPALRNGLSIGYAYAQRERHFRPVGFMNAVAAAIDIAVSVVLIALGFGVIGVILGTVAGEALRLVLSYRLFPASVTLEWRPSAIKDLLSYGRWIWASGLIVAALDQIDKAVIGIWLGVEELGYYQMAGRLSQLLAAEFGLVLGRYLFPTISHAHRQDPSKAEALISYGVNLSIHFVVLMGFALEAVGMDLIIKFLGTEWLPMLVYLRILLIAMASSGVNAVLSAYLRATGRPSAVAVATGIQLALVTALYFVLGSIWQGVGIAWATALGIVTAGVILYALGGRLHLARETLPLTVIAAAGMALSTWLPSLGWFTLLAGLGIMALVSWKYWRQAIVQLVNVE